MGDLTLPIIDLTPRHERPGRAAMARSLDDGCAPGYVGTLTAADARMVDR